MSFRRNPQQNVRDVVIEDLQAEIRQLWERFERIESRGVEHRRKRRSHHPTTLNDKEDNSPTVPDPDPLWSSGPNWDSEPKWDDEPNWDDNPIQLLDQSQNVKIPLEETNTKVHHPIFTGVCSSQHLEPNVRHQLRVVKKNLKPLLHPVSSDDDDDDDDDDGIVIGPPRPSPPSSSEMLDVEEKEEGDMIGPPRSPHDTWDDGSDLDLDDLLLNDKLWIPLSNEIVLKGHSRIVSALAVDHSGSRVFSGSYDYTVRMYDIQGMNSKLRSFKQLEPFEGHQVQSLSWSIGKDVSVLQHAIEKDLDSAAWFDVPSEAENAVCEKGGTMRPPPWPSWRSEFSL